MNTYRLILLYLLAGCTVITFAFDPTRFRPGGGAALKPVLNKAARLRVNQDMSQHYRGYGENHQQLGKIKIPASSGSSIIPLFLYIFQTFTRPNELAWQLQSLPELVLPGRSQFN